jgi:phosphoribosyl-AMP cyclohydrolase
MDKGGDFWELSGGEGHLCDEDTVLLKVIQTGGAACHTGHRSCFYRKLEGDKLKVVGEKVFDPEEVYR